jgi:tRNA modification GTPase
MISQKPLSIAISASKGAGLDELVAAIKELSGMRTTGEGSFMARQRHLHAINEAQQYIGNALARAKAGQGELVAEELKQAQDILGEITGEVSSDDLLGKIFSEFCIGK